ncbi:RHS repeat-associated core domain-containing protein [Actinoplanes sp. N902-109]|uniref:RHS repeat-associated core domain-containing protein n=1 Tax=Actinoplanes sp. (strain N902-109) TaxID=649831 RepID=UPI000329649C|nr:RHS repeat-associated core domain-containing protein [Actinoplanes sp. N902-109]AGL18967.1 YD repeat-containing protein [Actinoplanes sp. N902-109]
MAGLTVAAAVLIAPHAAAAAKPAPPAPRHNPGVAANRARPAQHKTPGDRAAMVLTPSTAKVDLLAAAISVPKGTGPISNGSFSSFNLTDRITLDVNNASGNLLIRTTELSLPGIKQNLSFGSAYNSLFVGSQVPGGSLGNVWRTRTGADVKLIKADDNSVTYLASDGLAGKFTKTSTGYSAPSDIKATLAADGSGWKLTESGSGRELYFTSAGLLDKTLDRNDNVTDYTYNASNQLTSVKTDRGAGGAREAQLTWSNGRITKIAQSIDGSQARQVQYFYNSAGDLTGIDSATGRDVFFGYDSQHRITEINSGSWGSGDEGAWTELTYDAQHRVTSVTRVYDKKKDGSGSTTRFSYVSSTETQVADANQDLGKAVSAVPHTTYTINSEKRVTKTVDPAGKTRSKSYTSFSDVLSSTDATNNTSTNTYGANGGQSLTASASATGSKTTATFANAATPANPTGNFQPSSSADGQGNSTGYSYNGAGNRLSSKDALASEAKVDYNDDGTVKKSTSPAEGSNGTTYTYDTNKQLTKVTPPTGNSLAARDYTYDSFGRLQSATDGSGRTTHYEYDLDDRVEKTWYSDKTVPVEYEYDGAGNLYGRTDADGRLAVEYDRLNRVISRYGSLWYGYDAVGNLTGLSDQRGEAWYSYDNRNLLTGMDSGNAEYSFEYDDNGRRTYTRLGLKKTGSPQYVAETHNSYDKSGRINRTTTKRWQRVNGVDTAYTVYDMEYCYAKRVGTAACSAASTDDTSLRQWQTDHTKNDTVSVFSYDKGNRLTKATNINGKTYDYTYDSNGNRKTAADGSTTQTLTFNSANQITNSGYTYDATGNQTNGSAIRSAGYNAAEQTRTNKDAAGNTTTYNYAGPDQVELSYTQGPNPKGFWWGLTGGNGQPVLQYYETNDWYRQHYIELDDQQGPLGTMVYEEGGVDHHYFYVLDGLGSVVGLISDTGVLAGQRTYDPYGKLLSTTTATGDNELKNTILGFAGGIVDGDIAKGELVKFGARYYDPAIGRFTQQDALNQIGDPKNGNRYAYAGADPVNNVDPNGFQTQSIGGEICFGVPVCVGLSYDWDDKGNHGITGQVGTGEGWNVGYESGTGDVGTEAGAYGECTAGAISGSVSENLAGEENYSAGVGKPGLGCSVGVQGTVSF